MSALAVLLTPLALFGPLHKTRLHFIGMQYKLADGTTGGILLQGDKRQLPGDAGGASGRERRPGFRFR
jgi:hypothetical protein